MRKSVMGLVLAGMLVAGSAFAAEGHVAGGKSCCAKMGANGKPSDCVTFASLSLNADQKSKLESWQKECMDAGCTKDSHKAFLKKAKGILSAEQFAALKKECGAMHEGTRS